MVLKGSSKKKKQRGEVNILGSGEPTKSLAMPLQAGQKLARE